MYPSVAADGTLVYSDREPSPRRQLVWLDRGGDKIEETGLVQEVISALALSPEGRRVAFDAGSLPVRDVWVYDLERKSRTRLSTVPEDDFGPVWSPDGEQVAFSSARAGLTNADIFVRRADGSGEQQALVATPGFELVSDWSRDGRYLLYGIANSTFSNFDIWYLERKQDGSGWEPHPFLETPFMEFLPMISPDGRYLAYVSYESGRSEVYVQPFPQGGRKVTVSSNGGDSVRWRRDGKELFYVEEETLVAVAVSTVGDFSAGRTTRLFTHPGSLGRVGHRVPYDVSPDGRRFLLSEPVADDTAEASEPSIHVVQNWYEEFRDREQ
jgi:Tol biopolymer transport system component